VDASRDHTAEDRCRVVEQERRRAQALLTRMT